MTFQEALQKAAKYCAYQDRCQSEIRKKLHVWGLSGEETEAVIAELTSQGYISDQRYANAFVSGKYHIKSWGRQKIIRYLRMQGISERCVKEALLSVDFSDYEERLAHIAEKWRSAHGDITGPEASFKLRSYLFGKGYETDVVNKFLEVSLDIE